MFNERQSNASPYIYGIMSYLAQTIAKLNKGGLMKHRVLAGFLFISVLLLFANLQGQVSDGIFNWMEHNTSTADLQAGQYRAYFLEVEESIRVNENWFDAAYTNRIPITIKAGQVTGTGQFAWPVGGRITQVFAT